MPAHTDQHHSSGEFREADVGDMLSRRLLLTVNEAARLLSIGRPKMWQLVMAGEVLSVKIGASRRIPFKALEVYIERLSRGSQGQSTAEEQYATAG